MSAAPPVRPRFTPQPPDALTPEQRRVYDAVIGGPRAGSGALADENGALRGPFGPMLLSPPVGDALQALGAALRYRAGLTDRAREIATLLVADHCHSAYEWTAHVAHGRRAGLTDAEIASLTGDRPALTGVEALVAHTTLALLADGDLDDTRYAEAERELGQEALFELTVLVGYYRLLAGVLAVFRVPPA
jgi:4-carboxymuconolactone decarboxylase